MATPFTHDHMTRLRQALLDVFDDLDEFERLVLASLPLAH